MERNSIEASYIVDVRLKESAIHGNRCYAAKLDGLSLDESSLIGNLVHGSYLGGLKMEKALILTTAFKRTSVVGLWLHDAVIDRCRFAGCRLRNVALTTACRFEGSTFEDCMLSRVNFHGSIIRNVHLKDVRIDRIALADVEIDGTSSFLAALAVAQSLRSISAAN